MAKEEDKKLYFRFPDVGDGIVELYVTTSPIGVDNARKEWESETQEITFEQAVDESLAVLQYLDPELFKDLFIRIGDLYVELWTEMIKRYDDLFVFYRMGDDLGFKTNTLLETDTIRQHILPQYKRIIDVVHSSGKKIPVAQLR
ncbi:MAG: hypothetical protein U9R60_18425 [Bacteroidota bacterium]|nr:hypothetical protein [Bacteroidota bacterium]